MVSDIGGFGGLFDLKAAGYSDPILVAATDGVGTKLKIAIEFDRHDTVGIDLVAMCVNDLVVQGAEPLFFLDYIATGNLDPDTVTAIVFGIADACKDAGCGLIGGETAELPGLYAGGDYDLAGFAVGAAERDGLLPRGDIDAGDVVIGLASNGVHSNGYSLVRCVMEDAGLTCDVQAPFDAQHNLGETLLTPTRIYVKACLAALATGNIKALAHITGGGLIENIPRVLPDGLGVALDATTWTPPPIFTWLAKTGGIVATEMSRTFNCGIGMVLITGVESASTTCRILRDHGETASVIGEVTTLNEAPRVRISDLDKAFAG